MSIFTVFLILCFPSFCSGQQWHSYYISPHPSVNKTCTVSGNLTLNPCYSFQELIEESILQESSRVTLIFLSGIHIISHGYTVSNLSSLEILPRTKAEIQCQLQQNNIAFHGVDSLKILFLRFSGCSLAYSDAQFNPNVGSFAKLINCVFDYSRNYAVSISKNFKAAINVTIDNCIFSLNTQTIKISFSSEIENSIFISNSTFLNNQFQTLEVTSANLTLQDSLFINNTSTEGGAINSLFSSLRISNTVFRNNSADYGGAMRSYFSNITISNCLFQANKAEDGGGAISVPDILRFSDLAIYDTVFYENHAAHGGAIASLHLKAENCLFAKNTATVHGGALFLFDGNPEQEVKLINVEFIMNQALLHGGAIFCDRRESIANPGIVVNNGESKHNSATSGGFIYLAACRIEIVSLNSYLIADNNAVEGGAIYAEHESSVYFRVRSTHFVNNTSKKRGGAMFLANSKIYFDWDGTVSFLHNSVTLDRGEGGAIFSNDRGKCESIHEQNDSEKCFVESMTLYISWDIYRTKTFIFMNNHAYYGSVLYGGLLDRCIQRDKDFPLYGIDFFEAISQYNHTPFALTSDPVKLCLCSTNSSQQDCQVRELKMAKMRGQIIHLKLTPVDQDRHSLETVVKSDYKESLAKLDQGEGRQLLSKCNIVSYHIFTALDSATLVLQPEGPCERSPLSSFTVNILLLPCPVGFEQHKDRCTCDRRLKNYFNIRVCDINNNSVSKEGLIRFWLEYSDGLLKAHPNCPMDYCQVSSNSISLSSSDEQCANHRSGVLCGTCRENHSIALGGSKCLRCTSSYTFLWLTPVLAMAGLALVALLLLLNMTISHGTLEGLIFFANVVSASGVMSLHSCSIHPILSVFIAWLNLDLGVETCFYPGMDTYQKMWLQFVFPLYIWLLVAAIIVASYYSSRAMRVFGRNNIAILATLFRLSYNKILKTVIVALSATQLLEGNASDVTSPLTPSTVWAYDANIKYLEGRHAVLFTVAVLLLVFLFLPYTFLLTFGQCMQAVSVSSKYVRKIVRSTAFTSIMDAYHAPYRKKHRYWPGLILLTQCLLFICFTINSQMMSKMYFTTLVVAGLITLQTCIRAYRSPYLNGLQLWFVLNLLILSATLNFLSNKSSTVICDTTSASISVTFVSFFAISGYHAYLRAKKTKLCVAVKRILHDKFGARNATGEDGEKIAGIILSRTEHPTTTIVDLREELLETSDKMK